MKINKQNKTPTLENWGFVQLCFLGAALADF